MLSSLPAFKNEPVAMAMLHGASSLDARQAPAAPTQVRGGDSLRLATRSRLEAMEAGAFWQALLHPQLNMQEYGSLLQQLSSVWLPISRGLRERAEGLGRADWLPNVGTARLQADLACLRRHGVMPPSLRPRLADLPRGDSHHLLGMATVVRQLQLEGLRVARHVDDRLGLGGEGRRFFQDPARSDEDFRSDWAAWRQHLNQELRQRDACESAIRGACGLIDLLQARLSDALLVA